MYKDSIVQTFNEDGHEFILTHYFDTRECYQFVKKEAEEYWSTKNKRDASENYVFDEEVSWSLGKMLENGSFELGYSVLTMDGKFLAAGGLRKLGDDKTICLSRFFGIQSLHPYGNAFILPLHIKISKEHDIKEALITFNRYNEHLLNYYQKILPRKTDKISKIVLENIKEFKSQGLQTVNNTEQFVISMKIPYDR